MILLADKNGVVVQTIFGDDASAFTDEDSLTPHKASDPKAGIGWVLRDGEFVPPPVTADAAGAAMERRISESLPPSRQARALASGKGADLLAFLDAMDAASEALVEKHEDPNEPKHWPQPDDFGL